MNKTVFNVKNKRILWALSIWTYWMIFYALVMYLQIKEINFLTAIISSAYYNYIFAFLSFVIWYLCKKIPYEQIHVFIFLLIHFILAIVFSCTWLSLFYGSWFLVEGKIIFERINFHEIIGWQYLYGMLQYFLVSGIFYTIIYYKNYKEKQLKETELRLLTRDAELKALKLQMNPHFLFNSLNSINALVTQDSGLARKMISRLSELFRMSLEMHDKLMVTLNEELDFVHVYLDIEQMRFGDKMVYNESVDDELLAKKFPAMLLQPLMENAIKHGISNSITGGEINLTIKKIDNRIQGMVSNQRADSGKSVSNIDSNNGVGLKNIQQRLERLYETNYHWSIDLSESNVFRVVFELPLE